MRVVVITSNSINTINSTIVALFPCFFSFIVEQIIGIVHVPCDLGATTDA